MITANVTVDHVKRRLAASPAFLIALIYAMILASLPLNVFKDRANYLTYAADSWAILGRYWSQGFASTLTNEPLWLLINVSLGTMLSPEWVLRTVIFLPAFVVAWLVLRHDTRNLVWLIVFLLMVQVMKNHVIHLRQGVAIAIFLWGWFSDRPRNRWLSMVIAALVHASFFFLLALYAVMQIARRLRLDPDIRLLIAASMGIAVGFGLDFLASFLGARQAGEYDFTSADVSGLGFLFWASVFILMIIEGVRYREKYSFQISAIIFYVSTYFIIEISARIFESALIVVLLAGLSLTRWRKNVFLTMVCAYAAFQYLVRMQAPWLGWGIGAA